MPIQRTVPSAAVLEHDEGNGCVNDHTRDFAATSWCHFLAPHLHCSAAEVAERVALVMKNDFKVAMAVAISSKSSDFTRRTMFSSAWSNGRN